MPVVQEKPQNSPYQPELEGFDIAYAPNPEDAVPDSFSRVILLAIADVYARRAEALAGDTSLDGRVLRGQYAKRTRILVEQAVSGLDLDLAETKDKVE